MEMKSIVITSDFQHYFSPHQSHKFNRVVKYLIYTFICIIIQNEIQVKMVSTYFNFQFSMSPSPIRN